MREVETAKCYQESLGVLMKLLGYPSIAEMKREKKFTHTPQIRAAMVDQNASTNFPRKSKCATIMV